MRDAELLACLCSLSSIATVNFPVPVSVVENMGEICLRLSLQRAGQGW